MNFKKFFCGMLSVLCLFSTPLQASAAQNKEMQTTIIEVSENVLTNPNVISSKSITLDDMKLGDKKILGTDNGEVFFVEVTGVRNGLARSNESVSKEFTFNKTTILGTKKTMFKVNLVCDWVSNGKSSKLKKLTGSYTTYDSSVSCSWDSNYTAISDTFATLGLDATYGSKSAFIIFSAGLNPDRTAVTLSCTT